MKITTSKPLRGRQGGHQNLSRLERSKFKISPKKNARVTILNQTNGGMVPWHKMQKQGTMNAEDSGDEIFTRNKQDNE